MVFDLLFLSVIAFGAYYGYKEGNLERVYQPLKLIVAVGVASRFGLGAAVLLTKWQLLKAESFGVLMLIGFLTVFALFWGTAYLLERFYGNHLLAKYAKQKRWLKTLFGAMEFGVLFSFFIFILLQFHWPRLTVKPHLNKSYAFSAIHRFYLGFLNDRFVNGVFFENDTGISPKELVFKTVGEATSKVLH